MYVTKKNETKEKRKYHFFYVTFILHKVNKKNIVLLGSGLLVLKVLVLDGDCQQKMKIKKKKTFQCKKLNHISRALLETKFNFTVERQYCCLA